MSTSVTQLVRVEIFADEQKAYRFSEWVYQEVRGGHLKSVRGHSMGPGWFVGNFLAENTEMIEHWLAKYEPRPGWERSEMVEAR